MRTISLISISQAFFTIIEGWKEYRLNSYIWIFFKDFMSGKRMIIVTYTSMISSDYKVRTAKVFSHNSMMNRFFWSCISHFGMKSNKHYSLNWKIIFD